jgi:hypothetical protein
MIGYVQSYITSQYHEIDYNLMYLFQQITYFVIRLALLVSWFWAMVLTCAPIFGLGLYYDEEKSLCTRYRNAVTTIDFSYAVFYVIFGEYLHVLIYKTSSVFKYCNKK